MGVLDRSHYEDIVTVRVAGSRRAWSGRGATARSKRFEQGLADDGDRDHQVLTCTSRATEFVERQLARLDDPAKQWKYNPGDLDVYGLWDDYLGAYGDVLTRCNPDHAPWYVIPADRKWYRNWAVAARLLIEALGGMGLEWPEGGPGRRGRASARAGARPARRPGVEWRRGGVHSADELGRGPRGEGRPFPAACRSSAGRT